MTLDKDKLRIVWLDVESTGADPSAGDQLLEVASIVTDGHLEEVGAPFECVLYFSPEETIALRERTIPVVQKMHDASGLWDRLKHGTAREIVDHELAAFFDERGVEPTSRIGGNSITLDRNFMSAYLPKSFAKFHYRSYDLSSIAGWFELYRPEVKPVEKKLAHTALADIRESLEEARYYAAALRDLNS